MQLRPYQHEALNAVLHEWENGNAKTLLVLPTGCGISTHTPHARRDLDCYYRKNRQMQFLLTRLMRGVTVKYFLNYNATTISTHTPHARRDIKVGDTLHELEYEISTHTPHARRDR